jgi:hypothetical protein
MTKNDEGATSGENRFLNPLLSNVRGITVRQSPLAPRKERAFAERKTTIKDRTPLSIGKLDDYYRDAQRSRPSASRSAARATQDSSHDETGRTWQ